MNQNKLIRLTTEDNNCVFDAQFNEEVLIAPQTEIALKSATVAFTSSIVVVSPSDNELSIFHDNLEHKIKIPPGTYSSKNIDDLFTTITNRLNGTMLLQEKDAELGLEYSVGVNDSQRVEIRCLKAHPTTPTGEDYYSAGEGQGRFWNQLNGIVTQESAQFANDGLLQRQNGASVTPDYGSLWFSDYPISAGLGVWRSSISQLKVPTGAGSVSGFEIGFVSGYEKFRQSHHDITTADVVCSIRVQASNAGGVGNIEFKSSSTGNYVDTGISLTNYANPAAAATNDVIEWRSTKNVTTSRHVLACFLIRNGQADRLIGEVERVGEHGPDKPLVGFYSLYSPPTFNDFTLINYFPSFFNSALSSLGEDLLKKRLLTTVNIPSTTLPVAPFEPDTDIRFRMKCVEPRIKDDIFGFPASLLSSTDPTIFYDITDIDLTFSIGEYDNDFARQAYPITGLQDMTVGVVAPARSFRVFGSQNYIVELLNLPLNSYDSLEIKRGRANILAVIPQNEFNQGNLDTVLMYEPNEMTYISLTNNSELSLRNIRARIVYPDYSSIDTFGLSSLVLHLRPSK